MSSLLPDEGLQSAKCELPAWSPFSLCWAADVPLCVLPCDKKTSGGRCPLCVLPYDALLIRGSAPGARVSQRGEFSQACSAVLAKQQLKRMQDWRMDYPLRQACREEVPKWCQVGSHSRKWPALSFNLLRWARGPWPLPTSPLHVRFSQRLPS
jgi:Cysteine rich repeat